MGSLRLRTTLLIPLLLLSFGGTIVSLLILRAIVQRQAVAALDADLRHSVQTYQNLARQRRQLLERESALLADLPSLKALMTGDERTIVDGGTEFWQVSGSDFFALLDRNSNLVAAYNRGALLDRGGVQSQVEGGPGRLNHPIFVSFNDRLFEISVQPLLFGSRERDSRLGFVVVGYEIDQGTAREVSEASAAEVAFVAQDRVIATTLDRRLQGSLMAQAGPLFGTPAQDRTLRLGKQAYLAAAVPLGAEQAGAGAPQLVVLKSFEQATRLTQSVNRWIFTLALFAIVAGTTMLVWISKTLTSPIRTLVEGTRALAQGNFEYRLGQDGVQEIQELSRAFERMRVELKRTQGELLDSERLATIGRMASSISHDLRHHLSAMYANAEFLSDGTLPQNEREELFLEVKSAVQGMTDLLDSLLLFTQTGRALQPAYTSLAALSQHAMGLVRSHPAARDVRVIAVGGAATDAFVDPQKLERALYNLLLNACQAARLGPRLAVVTIGLEEDTTSFRITVTDTGPGVPEGLRRSMFLPFVSQGKESGLGLGLTLAQQIAQEHGGTLELSDYHEGQTSFILTLPKSALARLAAEQTNRQGASNPIVQPESSTSMPVAPNDPQLLHEAEP